ncbi:hypothetical protein K9L05_01080 [Candidatus Babeliales bacterium]|nr:hypothetical protein [Candidatus Babeliales bacterium]MCF7899225.1 hypothetical protein [Candidatus Babeliales bacterium]
MKHYKIFLLLSFLIFTSQSFAMQNCQTLNRINPNIIYVYEINGNELVFPLRRVSSLQNGIPVYNFMYQTRYFRNSGIRQPGVNDGAQISFENLIDSITKATSETAQICLHNNNGGTFELDENEARYLKNIWLQCEKLCEQLFETCDQNLIKKYFLENITNLTLNLN